MQYISGISRQQMRISSLKDAISPDNQVRFIDAFVEYIELSKIGFADLGTGKCEVRDICTADYCFKHVFFKHFE